ncbi:hypothetical protein D1007_20939 [Hordeum vulgare]|nr:hypothetical protein D1007_20939 [Hordeum vulgare]
MLHLASLRGVPDAQPVSPILICCNARWDGEDEELRTLAKLAREWRRIHSSVARSVDCTTPSPSCGRRIYSHGAILQGCKMSSKVQEIVGTGTVVPTSTLTAAVVVHMDVEKATSNDRADETV